MDKIIVRVIDGVAHCDDPRVQIIDHDAGDHLIYCELPDSYKEELFEKHQFDNYSEAVEFINEKWEDDKHEQVRLVTGAVPDIPKRYSLQEVVANIAFLAGRKNLYAGDSRADIHTFIGWAEEFETLHAGEEWIKKDYTETVENFFNEKINGFTISVY